MRTHTALVATTFVTGISAFLVAPDILKSAIVKGSTITQLVASTQSVDVKCHECPVFVAEPVDRDQTGRESYGISKEKVPTTLHLEFSTKSGTLTVNNETVFPLEAINNQFPKIKVHQTRLDTGDDLVSVPIDFVLSTQKMEHARHPHHYEMSEDRELELITVDFTVIGMAGIPIKSQSAHADLILHDGVYSLAHLRAAKFHPTSPVEDDLKICKNSRNIQLCRFRLMANRKLREMILAALARAQGVKQWMKSHGPGNKARPCHKFGQGRISHGKGGPHFRHGGHDQFRHRPRRHGVLHAIVVIVKALIVPAIAGFIFGFTVSAIGMLVGKFIVFLWVRLYRGHRGPVRSHNEDVLETGEKQGLLEGEGEGEEQEQEPPAYEYRDDIPVHEESETKVETQQ